MSKVILFNRQTGLEVPHCLSAVMLNVTGEDVIDGVQKAIDMLKPLNIQFDGFAQITDEGFSPVETPFIIIDTRYEDHHDLKEYVIKALCRDEYDIDLYTEGFQAGGGHTNTLDVAQVILSQPLQA